MNCLSTTHCDVEGIIRYSEEASPKKAFGYARFLPLFISISSLTIAIVLKGRINQVRIVIGTRKSLFKRGRDSQANSGFIFFGLNFLSIEPSQIINEKSIKMELPSIEMSWFPWLRMAVYR